MEYRNKNIFTGVIGICMFGIFLVASFFIFDQNYQFPALILYLAIFCGLFLISVTFTVYHAYHKHQENNELNPLLP